MTRTRAMTLAGLTLACLSACVIADEWAGIQDTPQRPEHSVRVATYNVLNLFDDIDDPSLEGDVDDCHSYDKTVRAKPAEQCRAVAQAIRAIDADVIGLQEVESYDALIQFREAYLDGMGYDHVASVDVGYSRGVEQSVISRFPIKEVRVWPGAELGGVHPELWNGRPNRYAGDTLRWRRSPLMVTVEVPAGARGNDEAYDMTIFVVHHKSGRGNEYWREAEADKVIGLIEQQQRMDPNANVIVMGDFNAQPSDLSVRKYIDAGMHWTFEGESSDDALVTHESARIIDFILYSETMKSEVVDGSAFVQSAPLRPRGADWRTTPTPDGYASDHLPVVVDIVPVDR
ncbi:MAG: hypothetical protein Tsb0013_10240 [Phycisphaerales bacterium]